MTETRGFRVGLVTTLWGAIGVMVVVTAWALWPTFVEWWSVRTLIEKLKAAASEDNNDRCREIRRELTKLGSVAVPALLDLVKDSNSDARFWAIIALFDLTDDAVKPGIPAMIEALQDEDWRVRLAACVMLDEHPNITTAAIPALRERLLDREEHGYVRERALGVLREIKGFRSEVQQSLRELAERDDDDLREAAEKWLEDLVADEAPKAGGRVVAGDE